MKNLLSKSTAPGVSAEQFARLGASHGYRFDGDNVHINAMFTVLQPKAHQHNWALQLWACPEIPKSAAEVAGQLVAEIMLPPIGEVADDTESFDVSSIACTPSGSSEHVMVLVLATGNAGSFDQIQDFAVYSNPERFVHPRMAGNVGFRVEGNRVTIEVERIENPRDDSNLSGTLALELWALTEPYRGGSFQGVPLAGVAIDALSGGYEYFHRSFNLPFVAPQAGTWNAVLMLREWTANGFITRDFTNFAVPMIIVAPEATDAGRVMIPEATKTSAKTKAPAASKPGVVSVNSASKQELAAVKGLPTRVIEGIVAKRPFSSLEELLKVKGMGEKLLAKLRSKLRT